MANTILLLTDEHIAWGVETLDELLPFKEWIKNPVVGAAVEGIDGPVLKLTLKGINSKVSPFVPDEYKDEIHAALDDVIDGDDNYAEAIENALDILDDLKDKLDAAPWVLSLIDALIDIVKAVLLTLLDKAVEKED